MDGTSLPVQDAAPRAPDEPSGPYMVIPEEPRSRLLGIAVALSLMLHGGAVYFAFPRDGQHGAIDQETTAISVNLTRTDVIQSVPSPDESDQAQSNQGAGQPEPEAPIPEEDTPIAEEDTRVEAELQKAEEEVRAKSETEAREKAEIEAREKVEAESRIQAEQEARLKAEEQALYAAEAEARLKSQAEAEARQKEQEEAQRLAEAEQRRKEEAQRKAEAERRRREAEEEAREAREDKRREAEREARRKAAAKAQAQGKTNSAAKSAGRVSASSGAIITYYTRVRAHANARTNGIRTRGRGKVGVAFGLTASGAVTYARVRISSGNPSLDQDVVAALRRAGPFPTAPPGATGRQLEFTMPITVQ